MVGQQRQNRESDEDHQTSRSLEQNRSEDRRQHQSQGRGRRFEQQRSKRFTRWHQVDHVAQAVTQVVVEYVLQLVRERTCLLWPQLLGRLDR